MSPVSTILPIGPSPGITKLSVSTVILRTRVDVAPGGERRHVDTVADVGHILEGNPLRMEDRLPAGSAGPVGPGR